MTASNLSTLPSFSNILMKSFLGGCGTKDRQLCRESSSEPNPLKGGISCKITINYILIKCSVYTK